MTNFLTLTKQQGAKVMERLCPNCHGELMEVDEHRYHCVSCKAQYFGEEKRDPDADH